METHAHHIHKFFLAVFAGFLAENWREHLVEHQRAKQYESIDGGPVK
jgi:hypothetical protein